MKQYLTEKEFYNKIKEFEHKGPKGKVPIYAIRNRLKTKIMMIRLYTIWRADTSTEYAKFRNYIIIFFITYKNKKKN